MLRIENTELVGWDSTNLASTKSQDDEKNLFWRSQPTSIIDYRVMFQFVVATTLPTQRFKQYQLFSYCLHHNIIDILPSRSQGPASPIHMAVSILGNMAFL